VFVFDDNSHKPIRIFRALSGEPLRIQISKH